MRAVVIMPRSPTITILRSPNSPCTTSRISVNAVGSAVFPSKTRTATRLPSGRWQPVLDLHLALLAVPGPAARPQRAAPALQPRAGQVEQRHPGRFAAGPGAGGEPALDRVLPGSQPVHRRVLLVGGGVLDAEVRAERHIAPPGQGTASSLAPRPRHDHGQGQVPLAPPGRAARAGRACGHRVHGGDVPVRQRPGDADRRLAAGTRTSPFSAASTASTIRSGILDRFARVWFRTVPPSRQVRRSSRDSYWRSRPRLSVCRS